MQLIESIDNVSKDYHLSKSLNTGLFEQFHKKKDKK